MEINSRVVEILAAPLPGIRAKGWALELALVGWFVSSSNATGGRMRGSVVTRGEFGGDLTLSRGFARSARARGEQLLHGYVGREEHGANRCG